MANKFEDNHLGIPEIQPDVNHAPSLKSLEAKKTYTPVSPEIEEKIGSALKNPEARPEAHRVSPSEIKEKSPRGRKQTSTIQRPKEKPVRVESLQRRTERLQEQSAREKVDELAKTGKVGGVNLSNEQMNRLFENANMDEPLADAYEKIIKLNRSGNVNPKKKEALEKVIENIKSGDEKEVASSQRELLGIELEDAINAGNTDETNKLLDKNNLSGLKPIYAELIAKRQAGNLKSEEIKAEWNKATEEEIKRIDKRITRRAEKTAERHADEQKKFDEKWNAKEEEKPKEPEKSDALEQFKYLVKTMEGEEPAADKNEPKKERKTRQKYIQTTLDQDWGQGFEPDKPRFDFTPMMPAKTEATPATPQAARSAQETAAQRSEATERPETQSPAKETSARPSETPRVRTEASPAGPYRSETHESHSKAKPAEHAKPDAEHVKNLSKAQLKSKVSEVINYAFSSPESFDEELEANELREKEKHYYNQEDAFLTPKLRNKMQKDYLKLIRKLNKKYFIPTEISAKDALEQIHRIRSLRDSSFWGKFRNFCMGRDGKGFKPLFKKLFGRKPGRTMSAPVPAPENFPPASRRPEEPVAQPVALPPTPEASEALRARVRTELASGGPESLRKAVEKRLGNK